MGRLGKDARLAQLRRDLAGKSQAPAAAPPQAPMEPLPPLPDAPAAPAGAAKAGPEVRDLAPIRPRGHDFLHVPPRMAIGTEHPAELVLAPADPLMRALHDNLTSALLTAGVDEAALPPEGLTIHFQANLSGDPRFLGVTAVSTDQAIGPGETFRFGWLVEPRLDGPGLLTLDLSARAEAAGHAFRVAIVPLPLPVEIAGPPSED